MKIKSHSHAVKFNQCSLALHRRWIELKGLRYSEFQIGFIRSGAIIFPICGLLDGLIIYKGLGRMALYMLLSVGTYGLIIAGFTIFNMCKSFHRR